MRRLNPILLFLFVACHLSGTLPQFDSYQEGQAFELISQFLPENPVMIEAGGHYGEDSVRLAYFWPKGTVHAFEPNPTAFTKLLQNTKPYSNVHCYPLALNDEKGVFPFYINTTGGNDGASSLLEAGEIWLWYYKDIQIEVPAVTLDEWQEEFKIGMVDFMWLDLEGLELRVLQAAKNILTTCKVIYTEVNHREYRKNMVQYEELKEYLDSHEFVEIRYWPFSHVEQGNSLFVKKWLLEDL